LRILLLTGMLASGKSIALRVLQDLGYYCIDNLPPALIKPFIEIAKNSTPQIENVAIVVDMRGEAFFSSLNESIEFLSNAGDFTVFFFDANDEVLIGRYKLQRRKHLRAGSERIEETILRERAFLEPLKGLADYVIDTSETTDKQLTEKLVTLLSDPGQLSIELIFVSFGFKYGILRDADIVMDVRFLPNPYYDEDLRNLSGTDEKVAAFVLSDQKTTDFLSHFMPMLEFLVPHFVTEGKRQLVVGIGCSGGRHRSVAITEYVATSMDHSKNKIQIRHRDISKDNYGD